MHDEIRGAAEIAASHMVRYTTATSARAWTEEAQRLRAILTNPASEADLPVDDTMQRVVAAIRVQRLPATEIDLQRVRIPARVISSGPLQLGGIVVGQRLFVTIPGDRHTLAQAEQAIRALQCGRLNRWG